MKTFIILLLITAKWQSTHAEFMKSSKISCESQKSKQKIQVFPESGEIVISKLETNEEIDFLDNLMSTHIISNSKTNLSETTIREKNGETVVILKKSTKEFIATFHGDNSYSCI